MFEGVSIKSKRELEIMRDSGKILRDAHILVGERLREGVSTAEIDRIAYDYITAHGARPSFLGYNGFKGTVCISLNEELLHGIPSPNRFVKDGDLVKIDIGVCLKGFHTDAARSYDIGGRGNHSDIISCARDSFFEGIRFAESSKRLGDISHAIGEYIESKGYAVVRAYIGHGVGAKLHEPPDIPNYGLAGRGIRLRAGMTLAIEPMLTSKSHEVEVLKDDWTVAAKDGLPCAHYENTVLITDNGPEILTL